MAERLISKETTNRGIILGLVGGLIGMVAEIASLEVGGFGLAAAGVIYNYYESRKK